MDGLKDIRTQEQKDADKANEILAMMAKIPEPPKDSPFKLYAIRPCGYEPHPFVIDGKHVSIASDRFGGMLGMAALDNAMQRGIGCGMYLSLDGCKMHNGPKPGWKRCNLSYQAHKELKGLFIQVLVNEKLDDVPGLKEYLQSIAGVIEELGLDGVAFLGPNEKGAKV